MEKPAETQYAVHELIKKRWSPRAFDPKPVPSEVLKSLFEAARWAASSYNEQPWRYIMAPKENAAAFNQMVGCLVELNQLWAKNAPLLMLSFMRVQFSHNSTPNRVAMHDVGAASAQLTLEATARGLFVHQMAGIEIEKIKSTYRVPAEFEPVAALAIGYPGHPEQLPAKFQKPEKEPRTRHSFNDLFFSENWGKPAF